MFVIHYLHVQCLPSRAECQEQTVGFHAARFKKFSTEQEAQDFINGIKPKSKPDKSGSSDEEESASTKESKKPAKKSSTKE